MATSWEGAASVGGSNSAWVKVAWAKRKMVPVNGIGAIDKIASPW